MRRGWVRKSPRCSEQKQLKALESAGVDPIYINGKHENVTDFISSLRAKDEACVYTLARLASHRDALDQAIDDIHKKDCVIVEIHTGLRSDSRDGMKTMIFGAVREISGDRRTLSPEMALFYGEQGGRPIKEKMAKTEAEAVWFDRRLNSDQAIAKMWGWGKRTAYDTFGKRGAAAGRPIKMAPEPAPNVKTKSKSKRRKNRTR